MAERYVGIDLYRRHSVMPPRSLPDSGRLGKPMGLSVGELLSSYAKILAELRERGVVRSANAPAGDYAEWLCSRALAPPWSTTSR